MDVIDEEGRLFGVVNVIDALVVLLVLAVVIAGVALVDPFGSVNEATRYATIDLGDQPEYIAEQITPDDLMRPEGPGRNVTVMDVYVGPGGEEGVAVTVRAQINGTFEEDGMATPRFNYRGEPLTQGNAFTLDTEGYTAEGTITRMSRDDSTLATDTSRVAIESTVSAAIAHAIDDGDTYTIAGHDVATVQTVDVAPTGDITTRRVTLGLDIQTLDRRAGQFFGANRVTIGSTIPFETASYRVSGAITNSGSYLPAGSTTSRTVRVKAENVTPEFAEAITQGMAEESRRQETAQILDKRVEPASIILTSEDGNIFEREHPRNKDVYLVVEVVVRETRDGYQFHGQPLREGNTITLDFRTITVSGTVTKLAGA